MKKVVVVVISVLIISVSLFCFFGEKPEIVVSHDFYKSNTYERAINLKRGNVITGDIDMNVDFDGVLIYQFEISLEKSGSKELKITIDNRQITKYKKYEEYDEAGYVKIESVSDLGKLFEIPESGAYTMSIRFLTFPASHLEFLKARLKLYLQ